jgi:hypothetical protein
MTSNGFFTTIIEWKFKHISYIIKVTCNPDISFPDCNYRSRAHSLIVVNHVHRTIVYKLKLFSLKLQAFSRPAILYVSTERPNRLILPEIIPVRSALVSGWSRNSPASMASKKFIILFPSVGQ